MKKTKIELRLASKYNKLSEKFKKTGISKDRAEELSFHFMEIEYSFDGIMKNIDNMLIAKNKEKVLEKLEDIWSEFEVHVVNNHIIPAKKILDKII